MKKILYVFAFAMLFVGCETRKEEYPVVNDECRFQITYSQGLYGGNGNVNIIIDKTTGTKYLFYKSGYGAGLTKLEE